MKIETMMNIQTLQQLQSTRPRRLKANEKNKSNHATVDDNGVKKMDTDSGHNRLNLHREVAENEPDSQLMATAEKPADVDLVTESGGDDRSTTPGHSPGVGHSTGPSSTYP
ncbi:hypothetical protein F0562_027292 [Nyssa sinensis]|uniref:Uncharacterized protein n=1 Tax=Nyssa sinensis TaxID=561372 RepID=A0A5J5B511_9ASTE|nr:hypothetical protein F0562_027292 [Nyssa sinensis]